MASQVRTKSDARFLLIVLQLMVMPPLVKVIMLVKSHWQQVLSYQALSNHPSLPFNVQASQHMMMIALIVLISWGFPSYCVKCCERKVIWRFVFVLDLAVAGFVITTLVHRAQYFPTTFSRCAHGGGSEPMGKLFSYIALVANENKESNDYTIYDPDWACQDFLMEWVYVIMISYTWTVLSILGLLNLSWDAIIIALLISFFPIVLLFAIIVLAGLIAITLREWWSKICPCVSPPIKWLLWHLSWPLRIVWTTLVRIVPSIRYMARAQRKRTLMEASSPGSLDVEKGQYVSSSGSVLHMAKIRDAWIEPPPNVSNPNLASNSPIQQPTQAADTEVLNESSGKESLNARICGHGGDGHCWACGVQACSQCSVEISRLPQTTLHFFCEPRCSGCYLKTMCGTLPTKKSKPCSHRQDRCKTFQTPRVCLSCSENYSEEELLRRLEEQEREELLHLARHNLKCGVCEKRLQPKGPRWWTCCDCNEECNSDFHPPWSRVPE